MSSAGNDQEQLLFDYSLSLTSQSDSAAAQALISSNKEAAEFYRSLQTVLAPLGALEPEPCPDQLAQRTISRLANLANSGRRGLEDLLATEQSRPITIKVGFWRNFGEMAAIAAVLMLFASVLLPMLGRARQGYWKQRCQAQLSSVFQGLTNYLSEHDGKPPAVAAKPGQQWNTQCIYLPVKLGYLKDPAVFICPARDRRQVIQFDTSRAAEYSDFPTREHITYSPRKRCPDSLNEGGLCRGPILSDRNPIFDDQPLSRFKRRLDEASLKANSRNHAGEGQNVLYDDGQVKFTNIRVIGVANDDIFTLQDMGCGSEVGECELLPSCETDILLAP
jgi:hypothetical protein